jgi:hypothetical protein
VVRSSLVLLLAAFALGMAGVFWHGRRRLQGNLITANLALGSILHLVTAGLVVGGDRLWELGLLPALSANGFHFLIGLLGVGVASITWGWARQKTAGAARPPASAGLEPPPTTLPELAEAPDWDALAGRLPPAPTRQLRALQRIDLALDGVRDRRAQGAVRVVRQEVLRLVAQSESEARGAEEDDVLSQAASLLEWGAQKLPELGEIDVSDLMMAKAIADIRALHSRVDHVYVDHRELRAIHPIDRATADQKCNERAAAATAALPVLKANGMRLSESLIASSEPLAAFQSVTGFQVISMGAGEGYVTFEGNGRREALRRAFGAEGVQVEVRQYVFDDPSALAAVQRRVNRVRRWKNVVDT